MNEVGEKFIHNGITYHVGWMKAISGKDDFGMWLNEQPNGGFKWSFLDYKPVDDSSYQKIFIVAIDPRLG